MDCVAENAESYVDVAPRLANDRNWRDEIGNKISSRADVLYEDIETVRELERFFNGAQVNGKTEPTIVLSSD